MNYCLKKIEYVYPIKIYVKVIRIDVIYTINTIDETQILFFIEIIIRRIYELVLNRLNTVVGRTISSTSHRDLYGTTYLGVFIIRQQFII